MGAFDTSEQCKELYGDTPLIIDCRRRASKLHNEQVKLVLQALSDWGCTDAADLLSSRTGITCQSRSAQTFRNFVLSSKWDDAINFLDEIPFTSNSFKQRARLLLLRRKYIDLLCADPSSALRVLREQIAPICGTHHLNDLSTLLMGRSPEEIRQTASSIGIHGSTAMALSELNHVIPKSFLLAEKRFETVLAKSLAFDVLSCQNHDSSVSLSLLSDHSCSSPHVPSHQVYSLELPSTPEGFSFAYSSQNSTLFVGTSAGVYGVPKLVSRMTHDNSSVNIVHDAPFKLSDLEKVHTLCCTIDGLYLLVLNDCSFEIYKLDENKHIFSSTPVLSEHCLSCGVLFYNERRLFVAIGTHHASLDCSLLLYEIVGSNVFGLTEVIRLPAIRSLRTHTSETNAVEALILATDVSLSGGSILLQITTNQIMDTISSGAPLQAYFLTALAERVNALDTTVVSTPPFINCTALFACLADCSYSQLLVLQSCESLTASSLPLLLSTWRQIKWNSLESQLLVAPFRLDGLDVSRFDHKGGFGGAETLFASVGVCNGTRVPIWTLSSGLDHSRYSHETGIKPLYISCCSSVVNSVFFLPNADLCTMVTGSEDGVLRFFSPKLNEDHSPFAFLCCN
ncbi:hypothetical protein RCL1_002651 [Eukaryota sp. TZLM3-RCL]